MADLPPEVRAITDPPKDVVDNKTKRASRKGYAIGLRLRLGWGRSFGSYVDGIHTGAGTGASAPSRSISRTPG